MTAPLDEKAVMCGGCGAIDPQQRCIGCLHEFYPNRLAASPSPSMEMEVMAKLRARRTVDLTWPEGALKAIDAEQKLCLEAADALSQAQSALVAMRAERDEQYSNATKWFQNFSAAISRAEAAEARIKALEEEVAAKTAEFRDKVALGATDDEIMRFRDGYPNPAGGSKIFYRHSIEEARYRYADAVLAARALSSTEGHRR